MLFFFFKQKTAYDMRISDWSSDVCSSDLLDNVAARLLLDWDASDSLRFSFNLNGWRDQNDPTAPQYTKAVPQNPPGSAGPGGVVPANLPAFIYPPERQSVVSGKSVAVRVDLGGRRIIKIIKDTHSR